MKKIGTVFYVGKLVNHQKVDYITYIDKNETKERVQIEPNLPILYVGWKQVKSVVEWGNHYDISILEKTIKPNEIFWEFSFDENKSQNVAGVNMFVNNVPHFYFHTKYKYTNIDPIFFNIRDFDELKHLLPQTIDYYYQYKDKMLYLLSDNKITSIDLELYRFFDIDLSNILSELSITSNVGGMIDQEGETYNTYKKSFPNFEYLQRYLVTLLSK